MIPYTRGNQVPCHLYLLSGHACGVQQLNEAKLSCTHFPSAGWFHNSDLTVERLYTLITLYNNTVQSLSFLHRWLKRSQERSSIEQFALTP